MSLGGDIRDAISNFTLNLRDWVSAGEITPGTDIAEMLKQDLTPLLVALSDRADLGSGSEIPNPAETDDVPLTADEDDQSASDGSRPDWVVDAAADHENRQGPPSWLPEVEDGRPSAPGADLSGDEEEDAGSVESRPERISTMLDDRVVGQANAAEVKEQQGPPSWVPESQSERLSTPGAELSGDDEEDLGSAGSPPERISAMLDERVVGQANATEVKEQQGAPSWVPEAQGEKPSSPGADLSSGDEEESSAGSPPDWIVTMHDEKVVGHENAADARERQGPPTWVSDMLGGRDAWLETLPGGSIDLQPTAPAPAGGIADLVPLFAGGSVGGGFSAPIEAPGISLAAAHAHLAIPAAA